MTQAWYQVLSLGFGYISAAIIMVVVLLSLRKCASDRALWRRVRRDLPQAGAAGVFKALCKSLIAGATRGLRLVT